MTKKGEYNGPFFSREKDFIADWDNSKPRDLSPEGMGRIQGDIKALIGQEIPFERDRYYVSVENYADVVKDQKDDPGKYPEFGGRQWHCYKDENGKMQRRLV